MLEINGVYKDLGGHPVLKGCHLKIEDGHIFGLVGINGAGKSTLLRLIAGVYSVDAGSVSFDGARIADSPDIRREILLVGEDPWFTRASSINDLVEFYSSFYNFDKESYYKYLNLFGLDPCVPINSFSKGMKRQAFLIMALAIKPKLLLLDEAFDGLDPLVRLHFKKAIAELISDKNVSIIISSHNLKELEDICDSFGLLEDGVIKTSGDLSIAKSQINKYQIVFKEECDSVEITDLEILHKTDQGRVLTLVAKGDPQEVTEKLETYEPLLIDVLPVDFEELFIYEVEQRGTING